MGFPKQEYLPFPPPGDLPTPGIKPSSLVSPALAADSIQLVLPGKPLGWLLLLLFSHPVVSSSLWAHGLQQPGLPFPHHLPNFAQVHVHCMGEAIQPSHPLMSSSHLILWCPLLLLPSIFPSMRDFSSELAVHIRWPKYWSFSFSISPSNEYSGLISFKIDWFDLLAVHRTLRSLRQHHSLKVSILWCSAFFTVWLSQPYVTTGKTIALTLRIFVGRVMSLLFNTL